MKEHGLYYLYILYIENKKHNNVISNGSFSLLKISESSFIDFVYKYENVKEFKNKVDEVYKKNIRDDKISYILYEDTPINY